MKEYTTEFIRNIALVSHGSAGKTMLAEAFLHFTGATTRLGKIEDGTTASDYDEEEIRRKLSLYTSVLPVEYRDHKINFLDAPGYTDFVGEMISALSVADGAVILVDAVGGVEVGTELAYRTAGDLGLRASLSSTAWTARMPVSAALWRPWSSSCTLGWACCQGAAAHW